MLDTWRFNPTLHRDPKVTILNTVLVRGCAMVAVLRAHGPWMGTELFAE